MALGFITQRNTIVSGGAVATLPVLDEGFPADVEVAAGASATATFQCKIAEDGVPANYTYQWYKEGAAVDGANTAVYTLPAGSLSNAGSYSIYCTVTNDASTATSRIATLTAKIWKPTLNTSLPANVSVTASTGAVATFSVGIATAGNPTNYTYQWYLNNSIWSGQTNSTLSLTADWVNTHIGSHTIYCIVTNAAGSVQSRTAALAIADWKPVYSYTGTHSFIDDGNFQWRIKFLTSGTLTFSYLGNASNIDVFCVGGGQGNYYNVGGNGGGTQTTTIAVSANTSYPIAIGAGGSGPEHGGGGHTTFGSLVTGLGGAVGRGSGGGGADGGNGGSDGGPGGANGTQGQGTTTREFGEASGTLYSGGGGGFSSDDWSHVGAGGAGGGADCGKSAAANTGGGAGGGNGQYQVFAGGSGIVVIRNSRS